MPLPLSLTHVMRFVAGFPHMSHMMQALVVVILSLVFSYPVTR
jgi:hypothetical protein